MNEHLITPRLRRLFARALERRQVRDHRSYCRFGGSDAPLSWFRASSRPADALHYLGAQESGTSPLVWAPASFAEEVGAAFPQGKRRGASRDPAPPPLASPCRGTFPFANAARQPLSFVMNAAFLHETCLFFLLLRHPLPNSSLASLCALSEREPLQVSRNGTAEARTGHFILQNRCWESCSPHSVEATWLRAAIPAIDVQLELGASADPDAGHVEGPAESFGERGNTREAAIARLCSKDYLEHLIWPTDEAGAVRSELFADCAWVDVASVHSHALHHYRDAFWVPFSSSRSFDAWHHAALRAARDGECAAGGVGARRWIGDLYMCS
ncbi:hypothetical protein GH5_02754 [Leishmania sp. Ghana 2012 LV757]|uniref:hypothetical protein n=1 Tax=Leishmania sp. Ghana 2012 LV757 TaxID=2803181 RepID=UPI001B3FC44F|nr:hypothetical protein GH5_02754 [Leishmania sp. Ghana 2012 LV757]